MPDPFAVQDPPYVEEDWDKHQHALSGAALRFGSQALWPDAPRLAHLVAPLGIGLAKEAFDRTDPLHHTSDWKDAAATFLGASMALRDDRHGLTVVPTIGPDRVALDVLLRW